MTEYMVRDTWKVLEHQPTFNISIGGDLLNRVCFLAGRLTCVPGNFGGRH